MNNKKNIIVKIKCFCKNKRAYFNILKIEIINYFLNTKKNRALTKKTNE